MRASPVLAAFAFVAVSLTACSQETKDKTAEAANAIGNDMRNAAGNVANAADRLDVKAQRALNQADAAAKAVSNATGAALENTGRKLKK